MNDGFRMRLYALTCIACIAWLAQSVTSALKDGTLTTVPSIILIGAVYRLQRGATVDCARPSA